MIKVFRLSVYKPYVPWRRGEDRARIAKALESPLGGELGDKCDHAAFA
jgi:hypothetical protein